MLDEIKDLQNEAVSQLFYLFEKEDKKELIFKAPTGSGKTFMMADFCNRVLEKRNDIVFLISSLSKGDLAEQNYEKFVEYNKEKLDLYLIRTETTTEQALNIEKDHNVYFLPTDKTRSGGNLEKSGAFIDLLDYISENDKKIVWIKDESHRKTTNIDKYSERFSRIINFSATPTQGQVIDVELNEEEAVKSGLIKKINWKEGWEENNGIATLEEDLKEVLDKYEEVRKEYAKKKIGIDPSLIIQISNKEKGEEELKKIIKTLEDRGNINYIYSSQDKAMDNLTNDNGLRKISVSKWSNYVKNDDTINVIIFKLKITEGYDIPRACMLYQVRNTQSEQLDIQVIGRVRRNPKLLNFEKLNEEQRKLVTQCWIYGNKPKSIMEQCSLVRKDFFGTNLVKSIKTTKLKTLQERKDFDLEKFMENKKESLVSSLSIFELYKNITNTTTDIRKKIYEYSTTYSNWFKISSFIKDLEIESNNYICNYEESIEVDDKKLIFLPLKTYCLKTEYNKEIENWIWRRDKNESVIEEFYFDSEAERRFAIELNNLSKEYFLELGSFNGSDKIYTWGKNYLPESEIKFEYYLNGKHFSYPDFIAIDKFGRIHLFEVKSLEKSSKQNIDEKEYREKIEALESFYKVVSKKTNQYFYIPIYENGKWNIMAYINGDEKQIEIEDLEKIITSK